MKNQFPSAFRKTLLNLSLLAYAVVSSGQPRQATVIRDPCLNVRWQLQADPTHPAGPGRLVEFSGSFASGDPQREQWPLIRAGDCVLVTQSTGWVTALLMAVALEPARVGESFRVRLASGLGEGSRFFGGPVVQVEATGAGAARWLYGNGRQR